jgi:hypothetical protein
VAMLLVEHTVLASLAGARPERVGWGIGLVAGTALTLGSAAALGLSKRSLAGVHRGATAGMLLVCVFAPVVGESLPQAMAAVDWESLRLLACCGPILVVPVLVGYALPVGRWWPARRHGVRFGGRIQ